jgi:hypothetical protein
LKRAGAAGGSSDSKKANAGKRTAAKKAKWSKLSTGATESGAAKVKIKTKKWRKLRQGSKVKVQVQAINAVGTGPAVTETVRIKRR